MTDVAYRVALRQALRQWPRKRDSYLHFRALGDIQTTVTARLRWEGPSLRTAATAPVALSSLVICPLFYAEAPYWHTYLYLSI